MNGNNANDNNMMKGTNNNTRKRNNKQQESLNSSKHNKNHHQHRKQQQSKATNKQQQATQGEVYCCILVPDWFRLKKLCSCWHVDQPLQHVVNDKLSHGFFLFQPLWTRHYLTNQLSHLSLVIQRERSCLTSQGGITADLTWCSYSDETSCSDFFLSSSFMVNKPPLFWSQSWEVVTIFPSLVVSELENWCNRSHHCWCF